MHTTNTGFIVAFGERVISIFVGGSSTQIFNTVIIAHMIYVVYVFGHIPVMPQKNYAMFHD